MLFNLLLLWDLILLSLHIGGVENLMGLVAAGLAQILVVDSLDNRALMGFSQRHVRILLIQSGARSV